MSIKTDRQSRPKYTPYERASTSAEFRGVILRAQKSVALVSLDESAKSQIELLERTQQLAKIPGLNGVVAKIVHYPNHLGDEFNNVSSLHHTFDRTTPLSTFTPIDSVILFRKIELSQNPAVDGVILLDVFDIQPPKLVQGLGILILGTPKPESDQDQESSKSGLDVDEVNTRKRQTTFGVVRAGFGMSNNFNHRTILFDDTKVPYHQLSQLKTGSVVHCKAVAVTNAPDGYHSRPLVLQSTVVLSNDELKGLQYFDRSKYNKPIRTRRYLQFHTAGAMSEAYIDQSDCASEQLTSARVEFRDSKRLRRLAPDLVAVVSLPTLMGFGTSDLVQIEHDGLVLKPVVIKITIEEGGPKLYLQLNTGQSTEVYEHGLNKGESFWDIQKTVDKENVQFTLHLTEKASKWFTGNSNKLLAPFDRVVIEFQRAQLPPRTVQLPKDPYSNDYIDISEIAFVANDEQTRVAHFIINELPALVLVYGPPGTGKSILAAAIINKLLKKYPDLKILVACHSNNATTAVARKLRLISTSDPHSNIRVLRVLAANREVDAGECYEFSLHGLMENPPDSDNYLPIKRTIAEADKLRQSLRNIFELVHCNAGDVARAKQNIMKLKNDIDELDNRLPKLVLEVSRVNVVCATLSAAHDQRTTELTYDVIIVDEGANAPELSMFLALLKLRHEVKSTKTATEQPPIFGSVLIIGDPNQLPPLIKTTGEAGTLLSQTPHELFKGSATPQFHLTQQYRMHPALGNFISSVFYQNGLYNAVSGEERTFGVDNLPFPNRSTPLLIDHIAGKEEAGIGNSIQNKVEAQVLLKYLAFLKENDCDLNRVKIITFYEAQRRLLTDLLVTLPTNGIPDDIIKTCDSMQGDESDLVIVSAVRSGCKDIGFLKDSRRINVTLSRAKAGLIIIGDVNTLRKSPAFSAFVNYCEHFDCIRTNYSDTFALAEKPFYNNIGVCFYDNHERPEL